MDKALDTIMPGKIIKTRNVLSYLSDKIYEEQLEESASDVRNILASEKNYKASQIGINPVGLGKQVQGYLFLIPVRGLKDGGKIMFYANIGLQSGAVPTKNGFGRVGEEAYGRLEDILISLENNLIEKIFVIPEKWIDYYVNTAYIKRKTFSGNNCLVITDNEPSYEVIGSAENEDDFGMGYTFMDSVAFRKGSHGGGFFHCYTSPEISEPKIIDVKSPKDLEGFEVLNGIYFGGN